MANPILYYNEYSICSLFSKYTFDLYNATSEDEGHFDFDVKNVNIYTNEQLELDYLRVCPRGQVPTFIVQGREPMYDSEEITRWLAEQKPSLLPQEHKQEILALKKQIHAINFAALTFHGYPHRGDLVMDGVKERLERPDCTDEFRKLLHGKAGYMDKLMARTGGFSDDALIEAEKETRDFLGKIEKILPKNGQPFLFGQSKPTVLDPTVLVFVVRLHDGWRDYLIPPAVDAWAKPLWQGEVWKELKGGRNTWWFAQNGTAKPPASQPKKKAT